MFANEFEFAACCRERRLRRETTGALSKNTFSDCTKIKNDCVRGNTFPALHGFMFDVKGSSVKTKENQLIRVASHTMAELCMMS